ncbi:MULTISPECIES: DUF2612 domain-containing protein [unclassified Achromobacter]|uniref:DUF2612 domain-containing protein n=1 Tax=unclassified Achromobacter TaxID=2626865 RepID=UPI000B51D303|nr:MULTISPECIES: DUF2612 domain-containing protein [unclassified Achromobacter]OWT69202.1 hypothetical protein CEY05_28665 [Achromobacter sp. HZ34]OWT70607.1 hypothetical protein CEY04_27495 [Achromobacter sp. HZ28]
MADVDKYLDLITAEHRDKPNFSAMVGAVSQCFVDAQAVFGQMVTAYDLDSAIGKQLDAVGEWVGISRNVQTLLTGVYFSFDIDGLGFDQGVWQGPFDPDSGVTSLDDDTYRLLIRAKIGANHWDGTLEGSAQILNLIFGGTGTYVFIQDNGDMSIDIGVAGTRPTAIFLALLTGGYIPIKPEGVRVNYYIVPNIDGPLFGFDVSNEYISGFDTGVWGGLYAS